jgi:hypothetical protein
MTISPGFRIQRYIALTVPVGTARPGTTLGPESRHSIFVRGGIAEGPCQPCVSFIRYLKGAAFLSLRRATHNLRTALARGRFFSMHVDDC